METLLVWSLAIVLVLAGLLGLVVPALPGAPLLFAGLWLAAWIDDFMYVGWRTLVILGVLALLTYVVEFSATAFGAKRSGASNRAIIGAGLGALFGLFFGFVGVLIGPFLGAVIGELSARRGLQAATRAGIGATIGLALGVAAKLALAFSMLSIFAAARLF
ncbi:MAG: DUF456 domain-containing protein [Deltaproteobacteria bacterium]|nr:DUF456 domain-containing protein [Deltaproteobacteria bacterium]